MTPPSNETPATEHETFSGTIEIRTTQELGITVPLGVISTMRTQPDQTIVVDTLNESISVVDQTQSQSDASTVLETSIILRTTVLGDVLV